MANNINANQRIDAISVSGKIHTIAPFHGTAAEWDNNPLYIPAQGEIVIYDIDDNNDKSKFKIGDGETTVANLPFFTCDNGGDEKEMYGVDANKDGNVELIFGIYTEPLITFYIIGNGHVDTGDGPFESKKDMTWNEWINSEYCDINFIILDGFIYANGGAYALYGSNGPVSDTEIIQENATYEISY